MLQTGDTVERYVVEEVLGEGGMGTVYRARDTRLDRRVALKVVRTDKLARPEDRQKATERLLREARAAAAFHHPNAVSIFDVGEVDGMPFLAMELVNGRTLRAAMSDDTVSFAERARWLVDVAQALESAHRAGLVHRDVKPENVMVSEEGHVKVLDFGIARSTTAAVDPSAPTQANLGTLTAEGATIGTPFYMAPEQIKGDPVDGRADQFAWGVLVYELLGRRLPWRTHAETLGAVASILTETPPRLETLRDDIPPAVADVVERALSKSRDDRFPSMAEAARALERAASGDTRRSTRPEALDARSSPLDPSRAPSTPLPRRWSDEEMKQILERAMSQPDPREGVGYETMVQAAREVGIDPRAVERAARELDAKPDGVRFDPVVWRAAEKRKLLRHAATFLVIQCFFFSFMPWSGQRWIVFSWGIGVAMQAIKFFFGDPPDPERWERRTNRKRRRQLEKASKRVEAGVSELLSTAERLAAAGAAPRLRVREDAPRIRVESDERREEEEAERRESRGGKRSRR